MKRSSVVDYLNSGEPITGEVTRSHPELLGELAAVLKYLQSIPDNAELPYLIHRLAGKHLDEISGLVGDRDVSETISRNTNMVNLVNAALRAGGRGSPRVR